MHNRPRRVAHKPEVKAAICRECFMKSHTRVENLPGVVFAVRYPISTGFVWVPVIKVRDLVAQRLQAEAAVRIAYPLVDANPAYAPRFMAVDEIDLYRTDGDHGRAVEAYLRRHCVRIVVYMSASHSEIDGRLFRRLGVRIINTENNSYDDRRQQPWPYRMAKTILRTVLHRQLFDLHMPVSHGQYAFLRDFARYPETRMLLCRHGIDATQFTPGDRAAARAELGLDPSRIWIACACQARPVKRLEFIIDVAANLVSRFGRTIGFVHAGDGQCLPAWQAYAQRRGLSLDFRFLGYRPDLLPLYRAANVFVHAAAAEAFGLVVAEAMSCALPVVATHANGPDELVVDGQTGYLIDRDDRTAFAERIASYVDDPALAEAHGQSARARIMQDFSRDREADVMIAAIRRFLG